MTPTALSVTVGRLATDTTATAATALLLGLLVASQAPAVHSWKQLTPPTSFSIQQQHPAASGVGGHASVQHQHQLNSLGAGDAAAGTAHSSASITFGGADGGSQPTVSSHSIGHGGPTYATLAAALQPSSSSSSGSSSSSSSSEEEGVAYGDTEGRILHGGNEAVYESNYYGDFGASAIGHGGSDQCSAEKFAVEHEGTVQYEQTLPKLDQFTLCAWMRFTNHSGDHTVFTYALPKSQREIQFWVANQNGASYFSLAVHGQSLYRLNYPLKMRHWHHACTSWNGKTGEWQLWVKAERVGRGFHNRIVGHTIAPHGILYSGGPSQTGPVDHDLHMEVTMIQMYKVALSAGKAHRDHKHHHVHHFNHDGLATSTAAPPTPIPQIPLQPVNPLLANGQIATRLRINLAGVINPAEQQQQQQVLDGPQHATIGTQFVSGQFSSAERFITQQLVTNSGANGAAGSFKFPGAAPAPTSYIIGAPSDAPLQYADASGQHVLFKRNSKPSPAMASAPRAGPAAKRQVRKREAQASPATKAGRRHEKRALVQLTDGSVYDDGQLDSYDFDGLAQYGAPAFQAQLTKQMDIEDEIKQHDREPAEGEVQAVLEMCSVCAPEPFQGAIIFAWKDVRGLTKGALRGKALGTCGHF